MKKVLIITWLAFTGISVALGQSRFTPEEREEAIARHQAYMEKLDLTDEQKPKVEEINMRYLDGLSNLKQSSGSRLDKYRTFKSLSESRDQEMKQVLTREQYAIFKENQQEQRKNFRERRKNNG